MKKQHLGTILLTTLALASLSALPALAQLDTGIIEGTVRDASGAAIPNAAVTITETQTNLVYNATTSAAGNYVSPPLHVGIYTVSVGAPGFKTYTRSGITLQVQDRLRVDAPMEVGGRTEQVLVTGELPVVQTDTSALGQVMTAQVAQDMPLNGRNYLGMLNLTAGVVYTSVTFSAVGGSIGFSVNGNRIGVNNFVLDGVDNNSNDNRSNALEVTLDAIEEFKVQSSSYDAEFGRASGAAVNAVIKSGTNQYHGSAWMFYQNASLNAETFFATARPLGSKYYQPGATMGLPIIKNKLFFFADWQFTDLHSPSANKESVPVLNEAHGDFSGNIPSVKPLYDPNTTVVNAAGTSNRTPFPNMVIPANEISPRGQAYAALYPAANVAYPAVTNNYVTNTTAINQFMQGDGRADYRISDIDSIFARYSQSGQTTVTPQTMPGLACGCGYRTGNVVEPKKGASVGETHIFSPTTLNEFRIGFNWYYQHVGVPIGGYQPLPAALTIPGVITDPSYEGTPSMSVSSYATMGLGTDTPTTLSTSERQIRDTVNLVRGRHTIRIGGEMRWSQFNLFQINDLRSSMSFNGQFTSINGGSGGNGLADLLMGIPISGYTDTPTYINDRQHVPALFVQDDFKFSHNLTLNLGLRYEYYSPVYDYHNQESNFNYSTGQLFTAGLNSYGKYLYNTSKVNFAPRIGLAYTPFSKTVIRAAYGIFYEGQQDKEGGSQLQYNLPYFYQPSFTATGIAPSPNGVGGTLTIDHGFPSNSVKNAINPNVTSAESNQKTAYAQQWNLTVQRALFSGLSLQVAYVGMESNHLDDSTNQNQVVTPGPGLVQSRRPYPQYGSFSAIQNRAWADYNSLQVKVDKHLSHGLYLLSNFTFGRALTNDAGALYAYNLTLTKQLSSFSVQKTWVTSFNYLLPFGKGTAMLNYNNKILNGFVGGWNLTGIYAMQGGLPFTVSQSADNSNTGAGSSPPNRLANGNLSGSARGLHNWFNINAFVDAPQYTFGNTAADILWGPGLINLDFTLRKVFAITERMNLQLRMEAFNAPNHPNFGNPNGNIDAGVGAAGVITSVQGVNRISQVGLAPPDVRGPPQTQSSRENGSGPVAGNLRFSLLSRVGWVPGGPAHALPLLLPI